MAELPETLVLNYVSRGCVRLGVTARCARRTRAAGEHKQCKYLTTKRWGKGRNLSTWHVGLPASWRPITSWARIFMGGLIRNCCISPLFRRVIGPIVFAPRNYQAGKPPKGFGSQGFGPLDLFFFLSFSLRSRTLRGYLTSGEYCLSRSSFEGLEEITRER